MEDIITDFRGNFILQSSYCKETLLFKLRVFNPEQNQLTYFQLELKCQGMPDQLKDVFGGIQKLFQICFRKKKNYKIMQNGVIRISFTINFQEDVLQKQVDLHLVKQEIEIDPEWKSVYNQLSIVKTNQNDLIDRLSELKRKVLKFNKIIIPLETDHLKQFTLSQNQITTTSHQASLFVIDTDIVDSKEYEFLVQIHSLRGHLIIGVMDQKIAYEHHLSICNGKFCAVSTNGDYIVKQQVVENLDSFQNQISIKVNKNNGTLTFNFVSRKTNQMKTIKRQLNDLTEAKRIYPFVEFQHHSDSVSIVLK